MMDSIEYWWDSMQPHGPAWYAQIIEDGEISADSLDIWFEVNMEAYDEQDRLEVQASLEAAYPGFELVWRDDV